MVVQEPGPTSSSQLVNYQPTRRNQVFQEVAKTTEVLPLGSEGDINHLPQAPVKASRVSRPITRGPEGATMRPSKRTRVKAVTAPVEANRTRLPLYQL